MQWGFFSIEFLWISQVLYFFVFRVFAELAKKLNAVCFSSNQNVFMIVHVSSVSLLLYYSLLTEFLNHIAESLVDFLLLLQFIWRILIILYNMNHPCT